ncbi:LysR family transcriptional regulator [Massilia sp. W12]|uniref:LysR family transcriptional regulator n=1 Tax=Massilia sp. W12 TaxID=3126507 RepID=UPI0030D2B1E2
MRNPQHLATLARVVQAGSISAAAAQLGCSKSVLSRQLAMLEQELGVRLLQRSTRKLALTEIGRSVLHEAQHITRALDNIVQLAGAQQEQVCGVLRVSCSLAGRARLLPVAAEFLRRYPAVSLELQLEDRMVDLIGEQIDVAIRAAHLPDSTLVARKLTDNRNVLVAAPAYLAQHGTPQHPQDLTQHACLLYRQGARVWDEWRLGGPDGPHAIKVQGVLQVNDGSALIAAATLGCGILSIGGLLVQEELARGALLPVLPDYPSLAGSPVYAVYPARDKLALKTAAFVEMLAQRFAAPA